MGIFGSRSHYIYSFGLPKRLPARQPWRTIFRTLLIIIVVPGMIAFFGYHGDEATQMKIMVPTWILLGIYLLLSFYWFFCVKDPCGEEQKAREIAERAKNDPDNDGYIKITIGDSGKIKDIEVTFRDTSGFNQATPHASGSSSDAPADASAPPSSSSAPDSRYPTEEGESV